MCLGEQCWLNISLTLCVCVCVLRAGMYYLLQTGVCCVDCDGKCEVTCALLCVQVPPTLQTTTWWRTAARWSFWTSFFPSWRRMVSSRGNSPCLCGSMYARVLTPSLPHHVKFPGWKVHAFTCKQYIFWSYNKSLNIVHLDENPFTC